MESYTQCFPKINKVVEPLKVYERRHSYGEKEENINKKYFHSNRGSFKQGFGQGGIVEVASSASIDCKFLVMFSLIYTWSVSFKFVYDCIGLSFLDKYILS
jgi:hypothetical protein